MVNRVLRDDPSKSNMHNRQGLTPMKIFQILKDWRMWPLYILGLTHLSRSFLLPSEHLWFTRIGCHLKFPSVPHRHI